MGIVSVSSSPKMPYFVTSSIDGTLCVRSSQNGISLCVPLIFRGGDSEFVSRTDGSVESLVDLCTMFFWICDQTNQIITGNGNGIVKIWSFTNNISFFFVHFFQSQ